MGQPVFEEVVVDGLFTQISVEGCEALSTLEVAVERAIKRASQHARRAAARARKGTWAGRKVALAYALRKRGVKVVVAKAAKAEAKAPKAKANRKGRKPAAPKGLRRAVKLAGRQRRVIKTQTQTQVLRGTRRLAFRCAYSVGAAGAAKGGSKMDQAELARKQALFAQYQNLFKEVEALGLSNLHKGMVLTPTAAACLVTSLMVAEENPLVAYKAAAETEAKVSPVPATNRSLALLNFAYGLKPNADEGAVIPAGFATPHQNELGDNQSEFLLRMAGALPGKNPGVWHYAGFTFDLCQRTLNGYSVRQLLLLSLDGEDLIVAGEEEAMGWLILGAFSGVAEGLGKSPEKVLKGYIRVMYAKVWENGGYGYKDPATLAFLGTKTPIFQLGWGVAGYTVKPLDQTASESYGLAAAKQRLGSHGQGKFLVNLELEVLGIKVSTDATGAPVVYMASTAAAKWFKRLTLGLPLQLPMLQPDVGFFRTKGGDEHHGRYVETLFLEDGLNFPYLGNGVSMLTRKGMACLMGALTPVGHTVEWAGSHTPELPSPNQRVRKGDVLVNGPVPLVSDTYGIVLSATAEPGDGTTVVTVVVGNLDRTGQVKGRSETLKASVAYPAWTNVDWKSFCETHKLNAQRVRGDVAILDGLKVGDVVHALASQDVNKATGKGNAQGQLSLAANTLKEAVVYDPQADAEGAYDDLKKRFAAVAERMVMVAYAVLPEIAAAMKEANRDDCTFIPHGDVVVVIQRCRAWLATELVKVESLSVRESLTTGYAPVQVAMAANALGFKHGANMILAGGESLVEELEAVHETAYPQFDSAHCDALVSGGCSREAAVLSSFRLGGELLQDLGIPVVDVLHLDEMRRDAMLRRSMDPLGLPKRTAYIDTVDGRAVVIDPKVLKAFGSSDQESSLKMLLADLCFNAGHENAKEVSQLIRQLGGLLRSLATGAEVNKRAAKGCKTLQAKTSAGNVPQGWVAIGYNSNVALKLTRLFGVDSVDHLWGEVVYVYRSPQVAPVPLRIYMPDAAEDLLRHNKAVLPGGDMYLKSVPTLEPDRFFLSPFDTAMDNGDHDGDGRNLIAITCPFAKAEALAFEAEEFRKEVLAAYMAEVKDPVVEAYRQDATKRQWAKVGVMPYPAFVALSQDSIVNQTVDIGMAYEFAHLHLCAFGDFTPSRKNAVRCTSLFWGQYEEMLAGLIIKARELYQLLQDQSEFKDESGKLDVAAWQDAVKTANAELGHTESDTNAVLTLHQMLRSQKAVNSGKGEPTVNGLGLAKALIGQLIRDVAKGSFDKKGKLHASLKSAPEVLQLEVTPGFTLEALIAQKATEGSVGCQVLVRYFARVFPLIQANLLHTADDESAEGED